MCTSTCETAKRQRVTYHAEGACTDRHPPNPFRYRSDDRSVRHTNQKQVTLQHAEAVATRERTDAYFELLIQSCCAVLIQAREIGGICEQLRTERRLGNLIAKLQITFEFGFGFFHTIRRHQILTCEWKRERVKENQKPTYLGSTSVGFDFFLLLP